MSSIFVMQLQRVCVSSADALKVVQCALSASALETNVESMCIESTCRCRQAFIKTNETTQYQCQSTHAQLTFEDVIELICDTSGH